jgi:hypothetical protein
MLHILPSLIIEYYVDFLNGRVSVQVFHFLFISELPLKIKLSRQEGWVPSNWFNPVHLCACPKPKLGFPMSYVMAFSTLGNYVFLELPSDLRGAPILYY